MAKKKSNAASDKKAKETLAKLRSDLSSAQAKRDTWKQRATKAEAANADLVARLKTAEKALKKARKASAATTSAETTTAATPTAETTTAETTTAAEATSEGPDAGWTVAQLRAEARRRGLTGLSSKPKAELLAALA